MQITLCLYPRFSNFGLANTLEPLRAANMLAKRSIYRWRIVTLDGRPAPSSSDLELRADGDLAHTRGDALFLLPSYGVDQLTTLTNRRALQRAAGQHGIVVGLDTGAWLMADAGLLTQRRATIHWDEATRFAERFPDVEVAAARIVRDGPRWTCGGATTAFELVLDLIERDHGPALRSDVSALFMYGEGRTTPGRAPTGAARVDGAMALMRRNIAQPLSLPQLAKTLGLSVRHLEDLFARHLGESPRHVYGRLRLAQAKQLLETTELRVGEIAALVGYDDPSAMGRAFKHLYGTTPSQSRKAAEANNTG